MNDERITNGLSVGITQHPNIDVPSNRVRLSGHSVYIWFYLRLALGAAAMAIFIVLCWLASESKNGDARMLAGPILFLQTWAIEDHIFGVVAILILLPTVFAVIVWRNTAMAVLSAVAFLCWLFIGFWTVGIASV